MSPALYRAIGKVLKALRRLGVDVRPLTDGEGRVVGARLLWGREDNPNLRGTIVRAEADGVALLLFAENDFDAIQYHHRRGALYEMEELHLIRDHFAGGTFLDVGANVGNHAVYAIKVLGADKVIAFEPQDVAAAILEANVRLSGCAERVTLHRVGLTDRPGRANLDPLNNNLGATRLIESAAGGVTLVRGDDVLAGETAGFIKIDTEGFEMPVLGGLRGTIARDRPPLFVEVENENIAAFEAFCHDLDYRIIERFRRYDTSINLLAVSNAADAQD